MLIFDTFIKLLEAEFCKRGHNVKFKVDREIYGSIKMLCYKYNGAVKYWGIYEGITGEYNVRNKLVYFDLSDPECATKMVNEMTYQTKGK